jgi:hypothetical protein
VKHIPVTVVIVGVRQVDGGEGPSSKRSLNMQPRLLYCFGIEQHAEMIKRWRVKRRRKRGT